MTQLIAVVIVLYFGLFLDAGASEEPLQGKIEASTELPAIPPELRVGHVFKEENLPLMGTSQGWYWIPLWYAGTWHRELQTNFTPSGQLTALSRTLEEKQKGEQTDRCGGVWVHFCLPRKAIIEGEKFLEYQITTSREHILVNETQIVSRCRFIAIEVSKRNGKIAKVFQKEEFDTLSPEGQGTYFQDGWLTLYNEHGRRLFSQRAQAHYYQIHPFKPINIDSATGINLHVDFKNYLMSHGLANLIPIDELKDAQAVTY